MDTAVTLQSTIRIPEDVLFQDLNGEGVLLNLKTGVYFGLDPVGRRVWQLLQEHTTLTAVLDAMLVEYDVADSQCATDLLALVTDMYQHRLVTIG